MAKRRQGVRLDYIRDVLGFDRSKRTKIGGPVHVGCSQCEAMVINGHPTHETGCPNATHECRGCNAQIPMRQRYCEDCA